MDNVRAFDIPVDDIQRAKRFYEKIFGWQIHPIPGSGGDFHAAHTVPVNENDSVVNHTLKRRARASSQSENPSVKTCPFFDLTPTDVVSHGDCGSNSVNLTTAIQAAKKTATMTPTTRPK
jgi:catechol 2,3-dioxygenase-like lactoylglutathione lyase family enzyme